MPNANGSYSMEELKKKVLQKATKAPKTGKELATRVAIPGYDARALGRPIGELVREGKLLKHAARVPLYSKAG